MLESLFEPASLMGVPGLPRLQTGGSGLAGPSPGAARRGPGCVAAPGRWSVAPRLLGASRPEPPLGRPGPDRTSTPPPAWSDAALGRLGHDPALGAGGAIRPNGSQ